jgi:hypothetical protein
VPKKKDPPPDVVDLLAPNRPNPSKIVAKALSGVHVPGKAAKKAAKKGKKKRK